MNKALELINRNYRERISLEQLSRHCNLGTSRLSELFRCALGMSPVQYINELKIKKASQLLTYSDMNISQISEYLGFSSVHYFSRFFKSHTGKRPSEMTTAKS